MTQSSAIRSSRSPGSCLRKASLYWSSTSRVVRTLIALPSLPAVITASLMVRRSYLVGWSFGWSSPRRQTHRVTAESVRTIRSRPSRNGDGAGDVVRANEHLGNFMHRSALVDRWPVLAHGLDRGTGTTGNPEGCASLAEILGGLSLLPWFERSRASLHCVHDPPGDCGRRIRRRGAGRHRLRHDGPRHCHPAGRG